MSSSALEAPVGGSQEGFSLVETLVAMAMLAAAVALGWQLLTGGVGAAFRRAEEARALAVAQSRLAAVGIEAPLAIGSTSGIEQGVGWRVDQAPMPARSRVDNSLRVTPWRIRVEVTWQEAGKRRSRVFNSVRLAARLP